MDAIRCEVRRAAQDVCPPVSECLIRFPEMTNQRSDELTNECTSLALDDLRPFGVVTGDVRSKDGRGSKYAFKSAASPAEKGRVSGLWRGYISVYRLRADGRLILERYEYPFEDNRQPDVVNELLEGDFFLVMKRRFKGPRTYIPFKSGVVVSHKDEWHAEKIGT